MAKFREPTIGPAPALDAAPSSELPGVLAGLQRSVDPKELERTQPRVPRSLVVAPSEIAAAGAAPRDVGHCRHHERIETQRGVGGAVAQPGRHQIGEVVGAGAKPERIDRAGSARVPGSGEVPAHTDRPSSPAPPHCAG